MVAALELSLSQRFTQPYRPQANGKAARYIRTPLTEWAYATRRTGALPIYLHCHNLERRHTALNDQQPAHVCPWLYGQRPCRLQLATRPT